MKSEDPDDLGAWLRKALADCQKEADDAYAELERTTAVEILAIAVIKNPIEYDVALATITYNYDTAKANIDKDLTKCCEEAYEYVKKESQKNIE